MSQISYVFFQSSFHFLAFNGWIYQIYPISTYTPPTTEIAAIIKIAVSANYHYDVLTANNFEITSGLVRLVYLKGINFCGN